MPFKKIEKKTISISLDVKVIKRIKELSKANYRSISSTIEMLLKEQLEVMTQHETNSKSTKNC